MRSLMTGGCGVFCENDSFTPFGSITDIWQSFYCNSSYMEIPLERRFDA